MNFARSASCWATCLASMAWVYSRPKVSWVMDTSSNTMLKWSARCVRMRRMSLLTTCATTSSARQNVEILRSILPLQAHLTLTSRMVMSWLALYCAMTLLRVSWTEGKLISWRRQARDG